MIIQKLVEMVVRDLGLEQCRYTPTSSVRYTDKQHTETAVLPKEEITPLRAALGKLMHLALDRWDLHFACKDIAHGNCQPQQGTRGSCTELCATCGTTERGGCA